MSWQDLLQREDEKVVLPWTGGRRLLSAGPLYEVSGRLPREHGWQTFQVKGRRAFVVGPSDPNVECLSRRVTGYLVGDRLVPDGTRSLSGYEALMRASEPVLLLEPGLARFARVTAGRVADGAPLVFVGEEMPCGPEADVLSAYQDRRASLDGVRDVAPALEAAFLLETAQRAEAERARAELEAARLREEAEAARMEHEARLREQLSDAVGRRAMAVVDFSQAAQAALGLSEAEYLDHRPSANRGEMVVTFRLEGRRFECVCDARTLRIVDSGICLVDHRTGVRGDTWYTLETLPSVIREAMRTGKLHVFRRVDDDYGEARDDEDYYDDE